MGGYFCWKKNDYGTVFAFVAFVQIIEKPFSMKYLGIILASMYCDNGANVHKEMDHAIQKFLLIISIYQYKYTNLY